MDPASRSRWVVVLAAAMLFVSGVGVGFGLSTPSTPSVAASSPSADDADSVESTDSESPFGLSLPANTAAASNATYRVEPAGPGQLRVTVVVTAIEGAETVTLGFDDSSFRFRSWTGYRSEYDGTFESVEAARGDAETYRWTVDGERAELSYTVDANVSNVAFDGLDAAATDDWALVPTNLLFPDRIAVDGERIPDDGVEVDFGPYDEGYVGEGYAFLGPHDRMRFEAPGGEVTTVVPTAVDRPGLDQLRRTLLTAARELQVGGREGDLTVFVAPDGIRPGGRTVSGDFWVSAKPSVDIPPHEYAHTRQSFAAGSGMRWFVEGSAQYYGLRAALATDDLSYEAFRDELTGVDSGGTLNSPLRWEDSGTPYDKGGLVVAALDAKIRRASDGNRTLQHVVARMNAHDGPVDEAQFREYVAEAAGEPLDDWLDQYVAGSETPPLPDDESLYRFVESDDADGDGLPDREEAVVGTDPEDPDTDGDGVPDGEDPEPLVPAETTETPTSDGTTTDADATEDSGEGTDPDSPTDADGGSGAAAEETTAEDDRDDSAPAPGVLATLAAVLAGTAFAVRRRRR